MTPDELDAIEKRWRNASDPLRDDAPALHAALRQAWAVLDAALVVQDDLVRQRDLAQITMAEDAGRRIMDLTAEVEWQAEVIVDARDACQRAESIEPVGSPEWVESGIAMRTTVLREVRAILDRERNAHPFGLSTPSAVAGNRELAERAEQAEAAIARVRALCDDAEIAVDQGRAQGHVCGPDCHCDCLAVEDVRAAADTTRPLDGEGDDQ